MTAGDFEVNLRRTLRVARRCPGGYVYHDWNRGAGRLRLFKKPEDYLAFEQITGICHRILPRWLNLLDEFKQHLDRSLGRPHVADRRHMQESGVHLRAVRRPVIQQRPA